MSPVLVFEAPAHSAQFCPGLWFTDQEQGNVEIATAKVSDECTLCFGIIVANANECNRYIYSGDSNSQQSIQHSHKFVNEIDGFISLHPLIAKLLQGIHPYPDLATS